MSYLCIEQLKKHIFMKKIFMMIVLCFACAMSFAQVTIKEGHPLKNTKVSTTNCYIYEDETTDEYFLVVLSSHENERNSRQIKIKLGNDKYEAIQSIKDIETMYENATRFGCDYFMIDEYNCFVKKTFLLGVIHFPMYEHENPFFNGVFRIWGCFGELRIYTLAIEKFDKGEF